jgi:leader peptidase (prepilin peptidase)/N-methyltransferase
MSDEARILIYVWTGLLGLLVGSFLNVCVFRLPRNCMSVVRPRSRCPRCRVLIAWYDNIPVVSWILLGAKCRHCKVPISPRYAAVELLTGALFLVAAFKSFGAPRPIGLPDQAGLFLVQAWFVSCLVASAFIDYDFRILPDEITISGTVIGLLVAAFLPFLPFLRGDLADVLRLFHDAAARLGMSGAADALGSAVRRLVQAKSEGSRGLSLATAALGALAGSGVIYGIAAMGKRLFRKKMESLGQTEVMGFGDVKYMAMIGAVLGWRGALLTLVLACLFGSVVGIGKRILSGTMGYVPFGPFLSAGALVLLFWPKVVDDGIQAYLDFVRRLVQ